MSLIQSLRDIENGVEQAKLDAELARDARIEELLEEIRVLKGQNSQLEDDIADLNDQLDELRATCYTLQKQIPDLSKDPDPYGLHGIPLSQRLIAIGFPDA